jgi:hypothetical protein
MVDGVSIVALFGALEQAVSAIGGTTTAKAAPTGFNCTGGAATITGDGISVIAGV